MAGELIDFKELKSSLEEIAEESLIAGLPDFLRCIFHSNQWKIPIRGEKLTSKQIKTINEGLMFFYDKLFNYSRSGFPFEMITLQDFRVYLTYPELRSVVYKYNFSFFSPLDEQYVNSILYDNGINNDKPDPKHAGCVNAKFGHFCAELFKKEGIGCLYVFEGVNERIKVIPLNNEEVKHDLIAYAKTGSGIVKSIAEKEFDDSIKEFEIIEHGLAYGSKLGLRKNGNNVYAYLSEADSWPVGITSIGDKALIEGEFKKF